ncbi:MAG: hypothetical protein HN736_15020 [Anaerolineae bacterium]|nr:hypothetical protein [Anaerolineae bacterium]
MLRTIAENSNMQGQWNLHTFRRVWADAELHDIHHKFSPGKNAPIISPESSN